jgi:hypothetical protein
MLWVVRNGRAREDAVLIDEAGALALVRRIRTALDIVVEARDDVAVGRVLEVLGFFL